MKVGQAALLMYREKGFACTLLSCLGQPEKIIFNGVEFENARQEVIWEVELQIPMPLNFFGPQRFKRIPTTQRRLVPLTPETLQDIDSENLRLNPQLDLWFGRRI